MNSFLRLDVAFLAHMAHQEPFGSTQRIEILKEHDMFDLTFRCKETGQTWKIPYFVIKEFNFKFDKKTVKIRFNRWYLSDLYGVPGTFMEREFKFKLTDIEEVFNKLMAQDFPTWQLSKWGRSMTVVYPLLSF